MCLIASTSPLQNCLLGGGSAMNLVQLFNYIFSIELLLGGNLMPTKSKELHKHHRNAGEQPACSGVKPIYFNMITRNVPIIKKKIIS